MAKRRHLTPAEIKAQCNAVAREKRMADRSPWSAMSIICPYVVMKCEGFKGKRIARLIGKIKEFEEAWIDGKIDLDKFRERLKLKAEWTLEFKQWTEADITAKKRSYRYWMDKVQLEPQNRINQHAERYMLFFFVALIEEYGFGKERLTRVEEYMNQLILDYLLFVKFYASTFFTLFVPIIHKFFIIMRILCSQFFKLFSTSKNQLYTQFQDRYHFKSCTEIYSQISNK